MERPHRQSQDFGEIWNIQTDMETTQEKWDSIFHNRKEPWKCSGRKKVTGCKECKEIEHTGIDSKGNSFIVPIIGDLHANLEGLETLYKNNNFYKAIIVGDLCLYPTIESAKLDTKSYSKNKIAIEKLIQKIKNKQLTALSLETVSLLGNHDNFPDLNNDLFNKLNITYIKNGTLLEIGNLTIATLGGIYSPVKFNWNTSKLKEYNKRFYTREDIENLLTAIDSLNKNIDILITHEAAEGVLPTLPSKTDEGKKVLSDLLFEVNPKYYIHGHHHKQYEKHLFKKNKYDIEVIGLGNFGTNSNAFVKFNALTGKRIYT